MDLRIFANRMPASFSLITASKWSASRGMGMAMAMQVQLAALALGIVALLASSNTVGCAFLVVLPPAMRTRGSSGVI